MLIRLAIRFCACMARFFESFATAIYDIPPVAATNMNNEKIDNLVNFLLLFQSDTCREFFRYNVGGKQQTKR